jgi:hypothetical protein
MERIYQNCPIRYTLRQESSKGGANDAAAPGSRLQVGGILSDQTKILYEIFIFCAQKN